MSDDVISELLTLRVVVNQYGSVCYTNSAGLRHRKYGPALIWADGTQFWLQNDILHRTDGPAVISPNDNSHEWWVHGQEMSEQEFNEWKVSE